jgi:hypothetical protein
MPSRPARVVGCGILCGMVGNATHTHKYVVCDTQHGQHSAPLFWPLATPRSPLIRKECCGTMQASLCVLCNWLGGCASLTTQRCCCCQLCKRRLTPTHTLTPTHGRCPPWQHELVGAGRSCSHKLFLVPRHAHTYCVHSPDCPVSESHAPLLTTHSGF